MKANCSADELAEYHGKDPMIHHYIRISERSMRYIRKTYRETGEVVRTPVSAGRPRILDSSRHVSSDNQIFSLLKCKLNCLRRVPGDL
ncbi:hypothetical protein BDR03DRAFT_154270 [Suillus americanus]|nr:hypothetical protein BDR03DRAFT_154270 [Suillus americanus]